MDYQFMEAQRRFYTAMNALARTEQRRHEARGVCPMPLKRCEDVVLADELVWISPAEVEELRKQEPAPAVHPAALFWSLAIGALVVGALLRL